MSVFVTGATGFIGRALADRLLASGEKVQVLVRPGSAHDFSATVTVVQGDLGDRSSLVPLVSGCRRGYHLAARVSVWAHHHEFDRINVVGTENLLSVAREAKVERLVYTSTVMTIGPTNGTIADETTPPPNQDFLSDYHRTKTLAEQTALKWAQEGLPVVIVLPSLVLGPTRRMRPNSFNRLLLDLARGRIPAFPNPEQKITPAFIDDIVTGHILAMERGRPGSRYILGGEVVMVKQLVDEVNRLMGRHRSMRRLPKLLILAASAIEFLRARLLREEPRLTPRSVRIFYHDWAYDSALAKRELGYQSRPLAEALRLTLSSFGLLSSDQLDGVQD